MAFIDGIIEKAKSDSRRIVLPETEDPRVLKAAVTVQQEGIAEVILIGNPDTVSSSLQELGISQEFEIVDPVNGDLVDDYAHEFCEMRKHKGLTAEQAKSVMTQNIPHGVMLLHKNKADGLVAGAVHSTGDTLRPALQILKTAPGVPLVSSFFFMALGEATYIFADCGLVEEPDAEQLANIALASAKSATSFGIEPKVALLSYSTKGSANSPMTQKVVEATRIAQEKAKEMFPADLGVLIDGELQADAALTERVGSSKAPGSPVAGHARVLVFPDLNAGNIGYKLVQYLGGAGAYGPILQGIRKPVNDLSRGCTPEDIVAVAAITCVQSQIAE